MGKTNLCVSSIYLFGMTGEVMTGSQSIGAASPLFECSRLVRGNSITDGDHVSTVIAVCKYNSISDEPYTLWSMLQF